MVKRRTNRSMVQNREPRNRPPQYSQLTFDKGAKASNEERITLLTNCIETTGHPICKKMNLHTDFIPFTKLAQNKSKT